MQRFLALGLTFALLGCARYVAVPVVPGEVAAARAAASIDAAAVARRRAQLVRGSVDPAENPAVATAAMDRLTLFAAMLVGNADIAAARAAIATAKGARRAAGARPGPTLTLSAEYARNPPEASPWLFGGVVDLPIDAGGRRASRLASADLGIVAARYDYGESLWAVRMALRGALADRLIGERRLAASDDLVALRQRQFDVVARRVASGAASRAELERVRADAADASRRQAEAAVAIMAGTAGIAAALGVPASALAGHRLVWSGFDAPAPQPVADPAARQAALIGRADVLKAATLHDQAEADLRGEIARQYPAISIGPGYTWERGLVKFPVTLALVLPPLDANRGAIVAAEARRAEAGARLEAVVAGAAAAIDRALAETRLARAALAQVRNSEVQAARRLALQADHELAAGAIDRGEWAAAHAGAGLARLSELDALAAVHAADGRLEDALRRPVEGPELMIEHGVETVQ